MKGSRARAISIDPIEMRRDLALKLGAAGAMVAVPGQAPVRVAAHPAQARDTTGAGDAFCGAFMSRWLAGAPDPQITDLIAAAEFAAGIAASVVTRFGARPTTPG